MSYTDDSLIRKARSCRRSRISTRISYGCIGRSLSRLSTDSATGVRGSGRGCLR